MRKNFRTLASLLVPRLVTSSFPRLGGGLLGLLLSIFTASAAPYGPELEGELLPAESAPAADTGVAGCSDQYLEGGVALPDLPLFYTRTQNEHSWGSNLMIESIVSVGRHMRWLMPDASPITVGDISAERGGFLSGHITHRAGIDADIGLYHTANGRGGIQGPRGFDRLGEDFDAEANWAMISAFLDTGNVEWILLDQSHIHRLRAYVLSNGLLTESEAEDVFPTQNFYDHSGYVRHAPNHADHMHIRVLCADGSHAS